MTNTEIKKIYNRHLSETIPLDFKLDKGILYKSPVKDTLVGFCFEKSGFNKDCVYISAFVQPLYVESDCIVLTFGKRLKSKKNGELWHLKNNPEIDKAISELKPLMQKEIENFFPKVETPNDFYQYYKSKEVKNIRINEALVYSAIYSMNGHSKQILRNFIKELVKEDLEIGWIKNIFLKAIELERIIDDDHKVKSYLAKNISKTKSNLGL